MKTQTEILSKFESLTIWKNGDQRAIHKPVVILLAISKMLNEGKRYISYKEVRDEIASLLDQFGPQRNKQVPNEPFSRLPKDGIWELVKNGVLFPPPKGSIYNKSLIEDEIEGGFTQEVWEAFQTDKSTVRQVVERILNEHFQPSLFEDILSAFSLEGLFGDEAQEKKSRLYRPRDPKFRHRILEAYNYSCCICGYNLRLSNSIIGLEAAHIKWHQAGGSDSEVNGLSLCSIHHKLLDYGGITLNENFHVLPSSRLNGDVNVLDDLVYRYENKQILLPRKKGFYPDAYNIDWHVREVFKG